ncbi:hypothetical protein B0H19DRAFT_1313155 [Mycena capillaripes]|nr:hypothetical protein B0H19DRAFT_1313155 [Mycena capillaripes]
MCVASVDLFMTVAEIICTPCGRCFWRSENGAICSIPSEFAARSAHCGGSFPHRYAPSITRPVLAPKTDDPRGPPPFKPTIYAMADSAQSLVSETTRQLKVIRPRGEFFGIIILRAVIISGMVLAIPVFAVYSIILIPRKVKIQSNLLSDRFGQPWDPGVHQNAAIVIYEPPFFRAENLTYTVAAFESESLSIICPHTSVATFPSSAECPIHWSDIYKLTISLTFPPQNTPPLIHVVPGQGNNMDEILSFTDPIPVLPGTHLFAYMTWTSRQILSTIVVPSPTLYSQPRRTEISALSKINNLEAVSPLSSTVKLMQRDSIYTPTKWILESAATSMDGISAVGGLWSLVEGIFVLLFGANVVYFALGRRPLSALGIVHLFQGRTLMKQWNEAFPTLHDEGGRPGDESAGIVAFIRERLVNYERLEEDDDAKDAGTENDSEAQDDQPILPPHHNLERDIQLNPRAEYGKQKKKVNYEESGSKRGAEDKQPSSHGYSLSRSGVVYDNR